MKFMKMGNEDMKKDGWVEKKIKVDQCSGLCFNSLLKYLFFYIFCSVNQSSIKFWASLKCCLLTIVSGPDFFRII